MQDINPNVPKVAVIHPYLSVRGGAEGVACQTIRVLVEDGVHVTVFVAEEAGKARTALEGEIGSELASSVNIERASRGRISDFFARKPMVLLGYALLLRRLRALGSLDQFDMVLSTLGECDLVPGACQACYVHFPVLPAQSTDAMKLGGRLSRYPVLRGAYTKAARAVSGFEEIPDGALIMTNSFWTKGQIESLLGRTDTVVVYPPVKPFPSAEGVPPAQDECLVSLTLGRLEGYKGHADIVAALDAAATTCDARAIARFVGRGSDSDEQHLKSLRTERVDVEVIRNAPSADVGLAIATSHVGVSAFRYEHFGMATAELMASGLPVLVPSDGGQAEVVGNSMLQYADRGQLTDRFVALMNGSTDVAELKAFALSRGSEFTGDRFDAAFRSAYKPRLGLSN